jgi:hypothetical protein
MAMREARFSGPSYVQLANGSIKSSIAHVCQTFREHSQPNPSLDDNGKPGFLLQWELKAFKKEDLAKNHQKAIPMSVISTLAKQQISKLNQAIVQLTGLGIFFAFCSCKYLNVSKSEKRQMEQLHLRNICFLKDGEVIQHTHPDLEFPDCVSITFQHQKRDDKNDTITQEPSGDSVLCPMQFAAGLVWRIWSYKGTDSNTHVSAYISNGELAHVTLNQVINSLRDVVGAMGKSHPGISKTEIGTHLIRLGAAMAMYLGKCLVNTIMLIGWWSSNAFLCYIQKQVMEFSHNVSKKMLHFQHYQHVPNFDHRISAHNPRVENNPHNTKTRRNVGGDMSQCSRLPAFTQLN